MEKEKEVRKRPNFKIRRIICSLIALVILLGIPIGIYHIIKKGSKIDNHENKKSVTTEKVIST